MLKELLVEDGYIKFPLKDFEEMRKWEQDILHLAKLYELCCLNLLGVIKLNEDLATFFNDENNHLFKILCDLDGDNLFLIKGLEGVLESNSLDEARQISKYVLDTYSILCYNSCND